MAFRNPFSRISPELKLDAPRKHLLPKGERIYAIGDVHGRLDCLDQLLTQIDTDDAARGHAETTFIFLGDLMDRGPDSRGVIERAIEIARTRRTIFLMGNHEEVMIHAWEGDGRAAALFSRIGGRETALSYGVAPNQYETRAPDEFAALVGENVPAHHIAFLRGFLDSYGRGDYLFVHAGIRPGIALGHQKPADLRWIRGEFLDDGRDHGPMVVHGHSITQDIDQRHNRIGIDTGAFASGKLTAIGIEGGERWFLNS